ncbi:F0F1 ATP synthase subunit delta [Candidatus Kaiserbacteria bacterium]|nr:F0F1 ATP synthase subunit delta [Candidatus Kaiserbacteria bacterium]
MKAHDYSIATYDVLNSGTEPTVALTGLAQVLEKRGHTKLYSTVLRGLVHLLEQRGETSAHVSVAREQDIKTLKKEITNALHQLGAEGPHTVHVDGSLIGGFVAKYQNRIFDTSYKSQLVSLYRNATR